MKALDIIKEANQSLLRNKLRSFLTILAIFIGSFVIIISTGINAGVNDFIDKQMNSVGGEGYLEIMNTNATQQAAAMFSSEVQEYSEEEEEQNTDIFITEEQIEKAKKIDGVKSFDALPSAKAEYLQLVGKDKKIKVTNINLVPRGNLNMDLVAGRKADSDSDNYEIILTQEIAEAFGYKGDSLDDILGKKIYLAVPGTIKCYTVQKHSDCQTKVEAEIVGVQAPGILAMTGSRVNVALWNKMSEINNEGVPKENTLAVQATADVDPDKIDDIKKEMEDIGLTAMSLEDEIGSIKTFFDAMLTVLKIFGGIALVAASIGIINTLLMSVQERTREIGLDKALGMSNGRVFMNFATEAIFLGFWGSLFGIIVSFLIGKGVNFITHETILSSLPSFQLIIFRPLDLVGITVVIMLIALLAGVLPARKASKKDPIDSLRYE
ncbi:MAG: FtsX-like permease family protein [Candidatus Saccharibacteria bacterium]|nr:FtsX-like permease family protein [Candidatus Saccharibacteria bacterium]